MNHEPTHDPAALAKAFCDWMKRPVTIMTPTGVATIQWGDYAGLFADVARADNLLADLPATAVTDQVRELLEVVMDTLELIIPDDQTSPLASWGQNSDS